MPNEASFYDYLGGEVLTNKRNTVVGNTGITFCMIFCVVQNRDTMIPFQFCLREKDMVILVFVVVATFPALYGVA